MDSERSLVGAVVSLLEKASTDKASANANFGVLRGKALMAVFYLSRPQRSASTTQSAAAGLGLRWLARACDAKLLPSLERAMLRDPDSYAKQCAMCVG